MNEEAKVGRVTKSLCCTTIFEPCTSSVFAVSAFCQLIYSYQWHGDRAVGVAERRCEASRREVGHLYDASVLLCIRVLSALWASPLWGRTTCDTLTWDPRNERRTNERDREIEKERVSWHTMESGYRFCVFALGRVVYAKRSAQRVTMSAARSGSLRLIIRYYFCTSSVPISPPVSPPLFSSRALPHPASN